MYVFYQNTYISREEREKVYGHKSGVVWLTGLSGAGKSTIAHKLELYLFEKGIRVYVLDGDNVRHGLNKDLGFSMEDRKENIRRIAHVAALFVDAGILTICAIISPYKVDREMAREIIGKDKFLEVYVKCPLKVCEDRDPKGLYKKARSGLIKGFTGIDDPYEEPKNPDLVLDTSIMSIEECMNSLLELLRSRGWVSI